MERSGKVDRRALLVRPQEGMRDRVNDLARVLALKKKEKRTRNTVDFDGTAASPIRSR